MELKIDTKLDSSEDIKKAIKFLQEFVDKTEAIPQEKVTPQKIKLETINVKQEPKTIKPSKKEGNEDIDEKLEEVGIMVY